MTKTCAQCKATKPHAEFCSNKRMRDGKSSYCRKCSSEQNKAWRSANPETVKAMFAKWYHGESFQKRKGTYQRTANLKRHYGMTVAEYEAMADKQSGMCAICHRPPETKWRGKVTRLPVDHDHRTGAIRGLLCQECNRGMGLFGDNEALLLRAAAYLQRHRERQLKLA